MDSGKAVDNSVPAAARPSPFTINHFLAFLTRTLITKTGESPSVVNRYVRKLYGVIKPFEVDFPGHLPELITKIDMLPRSHTTAWYVSQARKEVLVFRHELEKVRQEPMPSARREQTEPASLSQLLIDFVR